MLAKAPRAGERHARRGRRPPRLGAVPGRDHRRAGGEGEGRRRGRRAAAPAPAPPAPPPPAAAAPAAPELAPAGPPPDLSGVPADYPGDDAGQKALAQWLAKHAEQAGLPPELPVMAALVESGRQEPRLRRRRLRRLLPDAGEHLEPGRVRRLPGQPGPPGEVVHRHRARAQAQQIARGDADFGKDPRTWGEWIADVERPAEQYRGRYQLRLEEARRLLR